MSEDMRIDAHRGMCTDMRRDMCTDMRTDAGMDVYSQVSWVPGSMGARCHRFEVSWV